jgi:hypothetical protein
MLFMWGTQSPISSLANAWHSKVTRGTKRTSKPIAALSGKVMSPLWGAWAHEL